MFWSRTADLLTTIRLLCALLLAWLGFSLGSSALTPATFLLLTCWVTDFFDGNTARRNPRHVPSSLGAHDLEVDMSASAGALLFLVGAGYVSSTAALGYVLVWMLVFWRYGVSKPTGSLMQAPVYGWFLWVAAHGAPLAFRWVLAWFAVSLLFTWRKFVYQVIPEFLTGMGQILHRR